MALAPPAIDERALYRKQRRRRNLLIGFAILGVAIAATLSQVTPKTAQLPVASNLVVFALFNLNLIVFLVLLVLLFRNIVKLGFERRRGVLGSRFKAKLVLAFLSLTLTPAILIFIIASNFINTSIEGWFKPQVERPLDKALEVAQMYYQSLETTGLRHARYMARSVERDGLLAEPRRQALATYLGEQQERLGLAAVTVFNREGQELVHVKDPVLAEIPSAALAGDRVAQALAGNDVTAAQELANGDMILAVAPIRNADRQPVGAVMVASHVSQRLEARLRIIGQAFQEYKQLKLLKNPIKGIYILLFLLMTLLIVLSATWFGLYLARGITDPIQMLAEGTREVAAGNLEYKVNVRAGDEIGILVDSFNRMTGDLGTSKAKLEEAYRDLQAKHTEMEARRRYTETVLGAVATGVVSVDQAGRVTTINGAAERMLGISAAVEGEPLSSVFRGAGYAEIAGLLQRLGRLPEGTAEREVHLRRDGQAVTLLASATALRGSEGADLGAVLVFDDLTDLLKAQRLAAWREVAQRLAHEIKNPLTPIQLSAQRLRRRLAGQGSPEEKRLLEEATSTIVQEVDGLKHLVEEFSRFARMPALAVRPTDLGRLLDGVVVLYRESHPALRISASADPALPEIEVDANQIKRAVLNLVDNAVEAVGGAGVVTVETSWLAAAHRVRIAVSDDGPGIAAEDRERVFLPYVSTKPTGMGLGLPIVHQVVTDHGGSIRVEENHPRGSRFVIELPAGPRPARAATPSEATAAPLSPAERLG
ncbi:MAG: ATP-binding protein [Candidatus Rokubacteria bacterium]|nr:ATP-binding protein [Candidatus Rokubacteria bacterium]